MLLLAALAFSQCKGMSATDKKHLERWFTCFISQPLRVFDSFFFCYVTWCEHFFTTGLQSTRVAILQRHLWWHPRWINILQFCTELSSISSVFRAHLLRICHSLVLIYTNLIQHQNVSLGHMECMWVIMLSADHSLPHHHHSNSKKRRNTTNVCEFGVNTL